MEPYQERVIEEQRELHVRRMKLTEFLGRGVSVASLAEKSRLRIQLDIMGAYERVLEMRIMAFELEAGA